MYSSPRVSLRQIRKDWPSISVPFGSVCAFQRYPIKSLECLTFNITLYLRHEVGTGPRRSILNVIVAWHMFGNDSDRVVFILRQEKRCCQALRGRHCSSANISACKVTDLRPLRYEGQLMPFEGPRSYPTTTTFWTIFVDVATSMNRDLCVEI